MPTRAVILGGGGIVGIAWEMGVLVGLAETGIDVRNADLFIGTSAGSFVAAQITSGLPMDELFQKQVDPNLQSKELTPSPDFQKMFDDTTRAIKAGGTKNEIMQRLGALALSTPTVAESERREVVSSRLPVHDWPKVGLEIVTINADTGERIALKRDSGVSLIDAVSASGALPFVWPPTTINGHHYIDGGCYSMANVDLATGFERVLVLQPDTPAFPLLEGLDEQVTRLQQKGTQVKVIRPNEAMKTALSKVGGNSLDPSLRTTAAQVGREQGIHDGTDIAAFWN